MCLRFDLRLGRSCICVCGQEVSGQAVQEVGWEARDRRASSETTRSVSRISVQPEVGVIGSGIRKGVRQEVLPTNVEWDLPPVQNSKAVCGGVEKGRDSPLCREV